MTKAYDNIQQIVNDDPDWAAFLYLSDDLATSDVVLFEDMLAEQDDLQVALINATRLLATVSTASVSTAARTDAAESATVAIATQAISRVDRRKRQAVLFNVCSLTLCVVVAAVSIWGRIGVNDGNQSAVASAALEAELDAMFEDANTSENDDIEDGEAVQELLTAWVDIQPEAADSDDEDVYSDSDLDVPDWMLTAVLLDEEDAGLELSPSGVDLSVPGRSESI